MDVVKIKRALLSVSDKAGVISLARFLHENGVELLSTGGTGKKLAEAGLPYTPMEKITGNPEAFGGRMKTISFPFASSLLFRRDNADDVATAQKMGIEPVDLVVCNLYPFEEARDSGANDAALVEEIDVGGPTMIRASAKNHNHVVVLTNPSQYESFVNEWKQTGGGSSLKFRQHQAVEAFRLLSTYDAAVFQELSRRFTGEEAQVMILDQGKKLRYGENPHQEATFYSDPKMSKVTSIASAEILQGKALSYNNLLDADAALRSASDAYLAVEEKKAVVSIVKHLNPCGLATGKNSLEALELAWAGDPVSSFGGILCFTQTLDLACAQWLSDKFIELLVVPKIEPDALALFAKKKNVRILLCPPRKTQKPELMMRSVYGGLLVQTEDDGLDTEWKCVTKQAFPEEKIPLARFGLMACKHLRSNAIALVQATSEGNFQLVGAGMGQPNRLDSIRALAAPRAREKKIKMENLVLISDAFFPFADGVEAAAHEGVKYILQPGGSIKDEEVIAAADKLGISMLFTGRRHFRH